MSTFFSDTFHFLLVTVVLGTIVRTLLGDLLSPAIKKWVIRTERDAIVWLHYRDHAARQGHRLRHPILCNDGDCTKVTK